MVFDFKNCGIIDYSKKFEIKSQILFTKVLNQV